jgi:hypothetical protein
MLLDTTNVGCGLAMLRELPDSIASLAFFDPQHRAVLDHVAYGNEGRGRGQQRCALRQQSADEIAAMGEELRRVLKPSGYVARWTTAYEIGEGLFQIPGLKVVAMLTWDSGKPAMPKRVQARGGYLIFMQKAPIGIRAQSLAVRWLLAPVIPGIYYETIRFPRSQHTHKKPVGLTADLINAITAPGDLVIDATAGSHTVLAAALGCHRHCWSTDIAPWRPPPSAPAPRFIIRSSWADDWSRHGPGLTGSGWLL